MFGPSAPEALILAGIRPGGGGPRLTRAIRHLRERMTDCAWHWQESPATINAVTLVTAALHFAAAWGYQPAFPAMMASAAASGFSLHGLAPFAAAQCIVMRGNPVSFQPPPYPHDRIDGFTFGTGQASAVALHVAVLDGWDRPSGLRGSVRIEAAHVRINDCHPGILVLSPGAASADSEQSLLMALQQSVQTAGRKNKGVLAVASVVSQIRPGQQPGEVSFGYSFGVVPNTAATWSHQPHVS